MSRKLNAYTKTQLKRSIITLIVLSTLILALVCSYTTVREKVATSEEMKVYATTLESLYKKLDSEEIKLLSGDNSQTVRCSIPNKDYGKISISEDSDGNFIILYDYQNSEWIEETLITSIFIFGFSNMGIFGLWFFIRRLIFFIKKKLREKKQNQTETT